MTPKQKLAMAILVIGLVIYFGALIQAGTLSLQHMATNPTEPLQVADFVEQSIIVIGSALATYFGSWLGISIKGGLSLTRGFGNPFTLEGLANLIPWLYFASLVVALLFWFGTGFSEYAAKPLSDLSYTILGVIAGVAAVYLKEG